MLKTLPWDLLGPVLAAIIIILFIVFGFILKFQKQSKPPVVPANPPRDINQTSKKTLCFTHEGKIAANQKAIEIFGGALKEANKNNSDQHGRIFDKIEAQGKEIIKEIHELNDKK